MIMSHYSISLRHLSYFFASPLLVAHRICYGSAFAWIIFATTCGHGGFITKIFSSKNLKCFSKLTYSIYLFHPILIIFVFNAKDHSTNFEPITIVSS